MEIIPEQTNTAPKNEKLQLTTMIAASVLLTLSILLGIWSGINRGQAMATYNNADMLREALEYYRNDQGVYPSQEQFYNQQVLTLLYFDKMPKQEGCSINSSSDFYYRKVSNSSYTLSFCLKQGVKGLSGGQWTLTKSLEGEKIEPGLPE